MSSTSDASLIAALNNASTQLNRYFAIFIIIFGVVGNTINICVLSRRPLRSNPCAWLFLASSIANGIGILAGLTTRPLTTWSADLTNTNQFLCKLRAFLLFNAITIGSWLIMLATVDRWLSSNIDANKRQRSTLKNAQIVSLIFLLTFPLAVDKLYSTITQSMPKSSLRITIENFVFNILLLVYNVSSGMPFYIYTLSGGSLFREALFSFLSTLGRKMMCQRG
ncbi:unnamed protein product [Rotaria sordida]|uniref:G-protein coupled receptors family 1 profile domain-containing protein n=2 Tax=Rotaria sordida TaxID=392033 RepID=A0A814X4D7_9BILA|nr:unnamed protein product [Rotaria sordida]